MAKAKQQLVISDDGFFVGRVLKDGSISADAYHISDAEIVAMFENYLTRYCFTKQKNILEICRGKRTVFEAKLHITN